MRVKFAVCIRHTLVILNTMQHVLPTNPNQQIVAGQYIYQVGHEQGGIVQPLTAVPATAIPQPVPTPVSIRPRPFRQLLGRENEVAWVVNLLHQQTPAEFYSEPGMGRTVLLRHLAYHPITNQFPDGVVYLVASQEPTTDILHALYSAFYQSATPHKPAASDLRRHLQSKNALILLDDFDAGREELDKLLNAAPLCTFLVASANRALWGDGEAKSLLGLHPEHALVLLEREWGRPLTADEQPYAQDIITALKGHPLRIQQAITAAREQQFALDDVAQQLQQPSAVAQISLPQLRQQLVAAFDESELQDLCFDLSVDYESLPAQGKANKARGLIELMMRNGRLPDLLTNCAALRPHLNWGEPTQAVVDPSINALPTEKRDILSVLAAFGDKPLSGELISQLVGETDVSALLEELMQRGLVQNTEYHLAGSLPYRFHSDLEPILLFVVEWVAEQPAATLQREAKTLAFLQQWAATNGRPTEALQLGRLLDGGLALDGRWGLWQQVLLIVQQAAQSLGDQATEAWSLNQLGCRALCLGDKGVARIQLERAKAINEAIGNVAGTAVNDHNLGVLRGIPSKTVSWRRFSPVILMAIVVLVLLGWWWQGTAVTPAATSTATAVTPPLVLPTETSMPTETAVSSATTLLSLTETPSATVATETAVPTTDTVTVTPSATILPSPTIEPTVTKTPTPRETATPTETIAPSETATPTETISPSETPTNTPTITLTPSPTNTRWPTPLPTFTPGPFTRPSLISPERGSSHRTSITFEWQGTLRPDQRYQVYLRHTDSGFTLDSPLLTESTWTTVLPAQQFGEWQWETAVVSNGLPRATSENWHFYLDPFPHSNDDPPPVPATSSPTSVPVSPTPTQTPTPTLPAPG